MHRNATTYESPTGERCTLAEDHITLLRTGHAWPKDSRGEPFGTVPLDSEHDAAPTFTERELMQMCCDGLNEHGRQCLRAHGFAPAGAASP